MDLINESTSPLEWVLWSDLLPKPPQDWIAWAAGLYEGEGSIVSSGKTGIKLTIAQKDYENEPSWILTKLQELFGGSIVNDGKSNMHRWSIFGDNVREFLVLVEPYLSPRRKQRINELRDQARKYTIDNNPRGRRSHWWRTN